MSCKIGGNHSGGVFQRGNTSPEVSSFRPVVAAFAATTGQNNGCVGAAGPHTPPPLEVSPERLQIGVAIEGQSRLALTFGGILVYADRNARWVLCVIAWTTTPNRWLRRGTAVALVLPARKGQQLDLVLTVVGLLLHDTDELVQKGYGWLLKEASKTHPQAIFSFVQQHRHSMSRRAQPSAMRWRNCHQSCARRRCAQRSYALQPGCADK